MCLSSPVITISRSITKIFAGLCEYAVQVLRWTNCRFLSGILWYPQISQFRISTFSTRFAYSFIPYSYTAKIFVTVSCPFRICLPEFWDDWFCGEYCDGFIAESDFRPWTFFFLLTGVIHIRHFLWYRVEGILKTDCSDDDENISHFSNHFIVYSSLRSPS